jgi:hypothetical protein
VEATKRCGVPSNSGSAARGAWGVLRRLGRTSASRRAVRIGTGAMDGRSTELGNFPGSQVWAGSGSVGSDPLRKKQFSNFDLLISIQRIIEK